MNLQHVNVKIFIEGELAVPPARFIDVFHRWVAEQLTEGTLIDVADYRHVPAGPGVVLIGLEADYGMDHAAGRYGLRYNRKAHLDGTNEDHFLQAFRSAAKACVLLEQELPDLKFSRREFELFINDRALAPHTAATYEHFKPALTAFVENGLEQSEFEATYREDPRELVGAVVRLQSDIDLAGGA